MKFGVKVKDAVAGGKFISYPRDGDNNYRFLEEIGEWTKYYEHFDRERRLSYPCPGRDAECPGCDEKARADAQAQAEGKDESDVWGPSKRYLVNVLTDQGYVNLVKLPASVHDDLTVYRDRYSTVCDRDYIVTRFKSEGRVKYAVDRGEPDKIDLSAHRAKMVDHEEMLTKAWLEAWGEPAQKRSEAEQSQDAPPRRAKREPQQETAERYATGQLKSQPESSNGETGRSAGPRVSVARDETKNWSGMPEQDAKEEIPSEPAGAAEPAQAEEAEEEVTEVTESEIRSMSATDLKGLIASCGLEVPVSDDSGALADYLIESLS